jgi:hypothetical protein
MQAIARHNHSFITFGKERSQNMDLQIRLPEINKNPGVYYAVTDDGIEVPIIDVTNPAFTVIDPPDLPQRIDKSIEDWKRRTRVPKLVFALMLKYIYRQSFLMTGVRKASGTFLSGMHTYLMKLGPDHLGAAWAKKFDRVIASSIPNFFFRKRLQEMARLMAKALTPMLAANGRYGLHFISIAGGHCSDSINALMYLKKENPDLLKNRVIKIHVLDLHGEAPAFGARALATLKSPGAPLQGVDVSMHYVLYDWSKPERLLEYLKSIDLRESVVAVSSEGGLFDYGKDGEIIDNLKVLHEATPENVVALGTLSPAEGKALSFVTETGSSSVVRRTIRGFRELAERTPWMVRECHDQVLHYIVQLGKR